MKTTCFVLLLSIMVLFQCAFLSAVDNYVEEVPVEAPVNPEFLNYMNVFEKGKLVYFLDDGRPADWNPSPVDPSRLVSADQGVVKSYPAAYDLRERNKLTPVRDQGSCGSSWAFTAFASLESGLMPSKQYDFSEYHMLTNHGFDYNACGGGHAFMATAYLAQWRGPVNESATGYPYSGVSGNNPMKHVQQVIFLPERSGSLDNDTIKYFISNYGALYCTLRWESSDFNYLTDSYCYSGNENTNHKVAIVGWDDSYSSDNFNTPPAGNGAFIVKDSYGGSWAENGYLYVSYYDTSIKRFVNFNSGESVNNYSKIYQYDPLGWTTSYGYGDRSAWGANIFTASGNESLKAVSFYTTDNNVDYEIYVYTGISAGQPRSGTLAATKTGSMTYVGYYTVALNSPVLLSSGQRFSIVIKFNNSSYTYPVAMEKPHSGFSSGAVANMGEGYISHSGTGWYDRATDNSNMSICIKAFTSDNNTANEPPFGDFATPTDGATVSSSIAVTGWALDDNGIDSVKIYREQGSALVYIGDATFIEGARPDIETAYPGYPGNSKAGWGYMLLTNFLPNGGNGTFKIHAIAKDISGQEVTLGVKTIYSDNANAVKPFGAIDQPLPGQKISGTFRIQGWALTPQPNRIPIDGSTIKVYIDGAYIGTCNYNVYRSDIASLFPGYANSNGALAYFDLDTTRYAAGLHTMQWVVTDSKGNTDGVGSRFFSIENSGERTEKIAGVATVTFPAGVISHNQEITLSKTSDPNIEKIFSELSATLFSVENRISYEVRIDTGKEFPSNSVGVEINIPQNFIAAMSPDFGVELFALVYQDGGMEILDNFVLIESQFNPDAKTLTAQLPNWVFTDQRNSAQTYEAILTIATTPGSNLDLAPATGFGSYLADTCMAAAIICPLSKCTVTSKFSKKNRKVLNNNRPHMGVDLRASIGTNVRAVEDGEVILARWQYNRKGYGQYIKVKHLNQSISVYAHLSKLKVAKGDKVKKGDIIALSGNTGGSTAPHLHFEYVPFGLVQKKKERIDPIPCIGQGNSDGSLTIRDNGVLADDAFEVYLNNILLGGTKIGDSNSIAVNNLRPGISKLKIKCTIAPDDIGTYEVTVTDGIIFSGGGTKKSGTLKEGASVDYNIEIPK